MDDLPQDLLLRHSVLVAVATTCLWTAVAGAFLSRPGRRELSNTLILGLLASAWYVFWGGTGSYTELPNGAPAWPMSPLFSGYTTPLMFLMVWQVSRPERTLPRWMWALPACGLFGTAFSVSMLSDPELARTLLVAARAGEDLTDTSAYQYWLYVGHTVELLAFSLASLGVLVHASIRSPFPEVRREMGMLLLVVLGAISAVMISNVIPLWTRMRPVAWLGPMSIAPVALMMLSTMRRSQRLAERLERERLELSRYVPKTVARGVAAGELREAEAEVTVLFADVRGFTSLTEELEPIEVLGMLQAYLGAMADVIDEHGGVVDKFIGDAVFAVFGLEGGPHAERAVACAEAMLLELDAFNASWTERGHLPLMVGIGLHSGRVVHGHIGSEDRREYAVLGDTVNTAARVEAMTKELELPLLLTDAVAARLPEAMRGRLVACGERVLRGRRARVHLFAMEGGVVRDTLTGATPRSQPVPDAKSG